MKTFDTLGRLDEIAVMKEGKIEAFAVQFYSSGNIKIVTTYFQNEENGVRREYHDNDQFELIKEYEIKNGVHTLGKFYQNGTLIKTETYNYAEELQKKEGEKKRQKISDG